MDTESLDRWDVHTTAKELMIEHTDTDHAPWTPIKRSAGARQEGRHGRTDRIIDDVHRGRSADDDLRLVVPAVEALRHGGLSYALDHLRVEAFDRAADAARRLGSDELDRTLRSAAEIARGHRGFALDQAAADFLREHGSASLHRALREAVTAVNPAGRTITGR